MREHRPDAEPSATFHRLKGRLRRALGWFTADRKVEASGEAERRTQRSPDPADEHRVEAEIKRRYGETA